MTTLARVTRCGESSLTETYQKGGEMRFPTAGHLKGFAIGVVAMLERPAGITVEVNAESPEDNPSKTRLLLTIGLSIAKDSPDGWDSNPLTRKVVIENAKIERQPDLKSMFRLIKITIVDELEKMKERHCELYRASFTAHMQQESQ